MRISAYTCIRNGIRLGYPWVEAVLSVLPAVDEYIIIDYFSDDGTYETALTLAKWDNRIRVYQREWPKITTDGSSIGLAQTEGLRLCTGDVCMLVQADEIHHEAPVLDYRRIFRNFYNSQYNGLEFDFRHVIHNFQEEMINPAYTRAIRLVRNMPQIISCHDGFSFWYAEPLIHIPMSKPIFHCGYEFPLNIPAKHLNHRQLYSNMDIYKQAASDAEERLDKAQHNEIDEIFTRTTTKISDLPAILRGLLNKRAYEVRMEYLEGWHLTHALRSA